MDPGIFQAHEFGTLDLGLRQSRSQVRGSESSRLSDLVLVCLPLNTTDLLSVTSVQLVPVRVLQCPSKAVWLSRLATLWNGHCRCNFKHHVRDPSVFTCCIMCYTHDKRCSLYTRRGRRSNYHRVEASSLPLYAQQCGNIGFLKDDNCYGWLSKSFRSAHQMYWEHLWSNGVVCPKRITASLRSRLLYCFSYLAN